MTDPRAPASEGTEPLDGDALSWGIAALEVARDTGKAADLTPKELDAVLAKLRALPVAPAAQINEENQMGRHSGAAFVGEPLPPTPQVPPASQLAPPGPPVAPAAQLAKEYWDERGVRLSLEDEAQAIADEWGFHSDMRGRASVCLTELLAKVRSVAPAGSEERERLAKMCQIAEEDCLRQGVRSIEGGAFNRQGEQMSEEREAFESAVMREYERRKLAYSNAIYGRLAWEADKSSTEITSEEVDAAEHWLDVLVMAAIRRGAVSEADLLKVAREIVADSYAEDPDGRPWEVLQTMAVLRRHYLPAVSEERIEAAAREITDALELSLRPTAVTTAEVIIASYLRRYFGAEGER